MTTGAKWILACFALAACAFMALGAGLAARSSVPAGLRAHDPGLDHRLYLLALRGELPGLADREHPFLERLTQAAFSQTGRAYVYGGTGAAGFDCSGFTSWSYARAGLALPRTSGEQYRQGRAVPAQALRQGDLVFFGSRGQVDHVGIYLSGGRFIHSSRGGGGVSVDQLGDARWQKTFAGARRVDRPGGGAP